MIAHPFQPAKLLWHSARVSQVLKGAPTFAPISVEWDLSNTCPHDCPFCSFGTSESGGYRQQNWTTFPTARAMDLPQEMARAGVRSVTFTGGGEPLMHAAADEIMRATSQAQLSFGLVTNGYLLPRVADVLKEEAVFVRVSLDAGTEESHTRLHRPKKPQFRIILDNMAALIEDARAYRSVRQRQPLVVGASFCVTDDNWSEVGTAAKLVRDLGGDYLEVRPTFPTEWRGDGWGMALSNVTAATQAIADARAAVETSTFRIIGMVDRFSSLAEPQKDYDACRIGPLTTVLGADGRLWHCCVQRGRDGFELGSVLETSFVEAWARALARKLEASIDVKRCPRCRYDNYNRLLAGMSRDALHVDFV